MPSKSSAVLLNPGPVNVTSRVRRALLRPDICHREPEFSSLSRSVQEKLSKIFGVRKSHSLGIFSGSGTTAVEAMLSSFGRKDKRILVLSNGVYGERMKTILERHDTPLRFLWAPIGDFPPLSEVRRALSDRSVEAVAMVHHETSSGMLNPLADVARLARRAGKFLLVDAVSSLGGEALDVASTDLCAGTSGKCLHGFPGISFVFVSRKARQALKNRPAPSLTMDLESALRHAEANDSAFTPAVQVLYALDEALSELKDEGLPRRIRRYRTLSEAVTRGMMRLGIRPLIEEPSRRSHVLSAFWMPEHVSYDALHDRLKKAGFVIYAGQNALKGRIFRVANLGDISRSDISRFFKSLAPSIRKRG